MVALLLPFLSSTFSFPCFYNKGIAQGVFWYKRIPQGLLLGARVEEDGLREGPKIAGELSAECPPTAFFDLDAIQDPSGLNIEISRDREVNVGGRNVREIILSFQSQVWKGEPWRHNALIYVPDGADTQYGAIFQSSGEIGYILRGEQPPAIYPVNAINFSRDTALALNIATMIIEGNPGKHFGMNTETELRDYTIEKMFEEEDMSWDLRIPMGTAYLRAATVFHSLVGTNEFVFGGHSKRGFALVLTACLSDPRVKGIWTSGDFGGNILNFQQYYEGDDLLADLDFSTPFGQECLRNLDPYYFLDCIRIPVMMNLGTEDPHIKYQMLQGFYPYLPYDKALFYDANVAHDWKTEKQLTTWQAFIAHVFFGRSLPAITTSVSQTLNQTSIEANIQSESEIKKVRLFSLLTAGTWQETTMNKVSEKLYQASLATVEDFLFFVEVSDEQSGLEGIVSSEIESAVPGSTPTYQIYLPIILKKYS